MPLSDIEIIDFPGFPTAVVRFADYPMDQMHIAMDSAFGALMSAMQSGDVLPSGPAFSRYESAPGATATFETGFPLDAPLAAPVRIGEIEIVPSELPATRLAIANHRGSYDELGQSWEAFIGEVREQGLTPGYPFWEAYDTQPTPDMDPADLVTGLAVPVSADDKG